MKSFLKMLVVLATFLCTTGFIYSTFTITVLDDDPDNPVFQLRSNDPLEQDTAPIELRSLLVYDTKNHSLNHPAKVWEIRSASEESRPVNTLAYGRVPEGFIEVTPARALMAGSEYNVSALGVGAVGQGRFSR